MKFIEHLVLCNTAALPSRSPYNIGITPNIATKNAAVFLRIPEEMAGGNRQAPAVKCFGGLTWSVPGPYSNI